MDLRTQGGGRVSWDEMREWHALIYTTKCKIASQWLSEVGNGGNGEVLVKVYKVSVMHDE